MRRLERAHDRERVDRLGDVVHAQEARPAAVGLDGRGQRCRDAILRRPAARRARRGTLARDARPAAGRPIARSRGRPRSSCEVVLERLAEADARVEADALLAHAGVDRGREPLLEEARDVVDDVVVARVVLHRPRLAEHVHQAEPDAGVGDDRPPCAGRGAARSRRSRATRRRPRAACATSALRVSIETVAPRRTSSSTTGSTRRSSSSGAHRVGPGPRRLAPDVDDRCASRSAARARARSRCAESTCRPPSENESGVTLTTPTTAGRGNASSMLVIRARRQRTGPPGRLPRRG